MNCTAPRCPDDGSFLRSKPPPNPPVEGSSCPCPETSGFEAVEISSGAGSHFRIPAQPLLELAMARLCASYVLQPLE